MPDYLINTSPCNYCYHHDACNAWVGHCSNIYTDFEYSVKNCPYFSSNLVEPEKEKSFADKIYEAYTNATNINILYNELKKLILNRAESGNNYISIDPSLGELYYRLRRHLKTLMKEIVEEGLRVEQITPTKYVIYWNYYE